MVHSFSLKGRDKAMRASPLLDDYSLRTPMGRKRLMKRIWQYRWIYLVLVLPTLLLTIVFRYLTLPGITLAFMSFKPIYGAGYDYQGPAFL